MRTSKLIAAPRAAPPPRCAGRDPKVVTTTEGLAALAREVGGDRVRVESLSRGVQDPHFVDANPILAVKLRNADLLVDVGPRPRDWLAAAAREPVAERAIQPGGPRRLTAASVVQVLDVPTGVVDRSRGDLHPGGNPHFLIDPRRALQVASRDRRAALGDRPGAARTLRARTSPRSSGRIEAGDPALAGGARAGEGQEAHHPAPDAHLLPRLDRARVGGRARAASPACRRRPRTSPTSSAWRSARE